MSPRVSRLRNTNSDRRWEELQKWLRETQALTHRLSDSQSPTVQEELKLYRTCLSDVQNAMSRISRRARTRPKERT